MESSATAEDVADTTSDGQSPGFDGQLGDGMDIEGSETMLIDEPAIDSEKSRDRSRLTEKLLEFKASRVKWMATIAKLDGDIAAIERTLPLL